MIIKISTESELQAMQNDLTATYELVNDITMTGNFIPIGNVSTPFTGVFKGNNFTINNLNIVTGSDYVALFGYCSGAIIDDLTIDGGFIASNFYSAALCAYGDSETIVRNCRVLNIENISNRYYGAVAGMFKGTMTRCYTSDCSFRVDGSNAGGLIGITEGANINNCYSHNDVYCDISAGGLIGECDQTSIVNCYCVGRVTDTEDNGAMVAIQTDSIATSCYYDGDVSGVKISALGTEKKEEDMKDEETFTGWDFNGVWFIETGEYPSLYQNINNDGLSVEVERTNNISITMSRTNNISFSIERSNNVTIEVSRG